MARLEDLQQDFLELNPDAQVSFFTAYWLRRETELVTSMKGKKKKKPSSSSRKKGKGRQIKVTGDQLKELRKMGLI